MNRRKNKNEELKKGSALLISVAILLVIGIITVVSVLINARMKSKTEDQSRVAQKGSQKQADQDLKQKKNEMGSALSFDQSGKTVAVGEKFSIQAMIDPKGKKIGAADLQIVFDPKTLKLEKIVPNDSFGLVLVDSNIDNEKGIASIVVGVPLEMKAVESFSPIASFNFEALANAAKTDVSFSDKSAAAAEGEAEDVVTLRTPATIKVQ